MGGPYIIPHDVIRAAPVSYLPFFSTISDSISISPPLGLSVRVGQNPPGGDWNHKTLFLKLFLWWNLCISTWTRSNWRKYIHYARFYKKNTKNSSLLDIFEHTFTDRTFGEPAVWIMHFRAPSFPPNLYRSIVKTRSRLFTRTESLLLQWEQKGVERHIFGPSTFLLPESQFEMRQTRISENFQLSNQVGFPFTLTHCCIELRTELLGSYCF